MSVHEQLPTAPPADWSAGAAAQPNQQPIINIGDTGGHKFSKYKVAGMIALGGAIVAMAGVGLKGCGVDLFHGIAAVAPTEVTKTNVSSVLTAIQPKNDVLLVNAKGNNFTTLNEDLQETGIDIPGITPLVNDGLQALTGMSVTVERTGNVQIFMPQNAITIEPYNTATGNQTGNTNSRTWGVKAVVREDELYAQNGNPGFVTGSDGQPVIPHSTGLLAKLWEATFDSSASFQQTAEGTVAADDAFMLGCSKVLASVTDPVTGQTVISSRIESDLRGQMLTYALALKGSKNAAQQEAGKTLDTLSASNIPIEFVNAKGKQVPAADISVSTPTIPNAKVIAKYLNEQDIAPGTKVNVSVSSMQDECYPNGQATGELMDIITTGGSTTVQKVA